jgi:hypothetical protein
VGVLLAFSRHAAQIQKSRERKAALEAADAMLYEWFSDLNQVPRKGKGKVPNSSRFDWSAQVVETHHREALGIDVVRIEIRARGKTQKDRPLLCTLDLAVPSPDWPPEKKQGPGT